MPFGTAPPLLYTSIPAGTGATSGETEFTLVKATRGGKNPLLVLSNSSKEFALMVFGLSPILTCVNAWLKQNIRLIKNENFWRLEFIGQRGYCIFSYTKVWEL